jgi:hypothetical protein
MTDHHCLYQHGWDTADWCHECAFDWAWFQRQCGTRVAGWLARKEYASIVEEVCDEALQLPADPEEPRRQAAQRFRLLPPDWLNAYEEARRCGQN